MIIKRIKLNNIRSYENCDIEFPEGSVLLSGDIGSGKTTILLATEFALFGLQPGQRGSSLLRNGKDEGTVILEIEVDNKLVAIQRKLKRSKTISQDVTTITNEDGEQTMAISQLKTHILSLLNYPAEFAKKTNMLYRFTVYTPQEEMKQIILEDAQTRMDTLRHIFGIDKYRRIKENTEILTLRLREEIRKKQGVIQGIDTLKKRILEKESKIEEIKSNLSSLQDQISMLMLNRKNKENELSEIQKSIDQKREIEKEMEKTKVMTAGKKDMLSSFLREDNQLSEQIKDLEKMSFNNDELQSLNLKKQDLSQKENEINKAYLDLSGKINSLLLKNQDNEKLKERIIKLQLCPTCLQTVDEQYKNNIISKMQDEKNENSKAIESLTKQKQEKSNQIEDTRKNIAETEKQIREINMIKIRLESLEEKKKKLLDIKRNLEKIEKDLQLLDAHLFSLKESSMKFSNISAIYEKKQDEFREAQKKEKEMEIKIAESKNEVYFNEREIETIKKDIETMNQVKRDLGFLVELEDWLSNRFLALVALTEKSVMQKLREEFSKVFNQWFSILVPESLVARLDEEFSPIIEQQDYELDYSFLSGGERTAVALAYRLSLNHVINSLMSHIKTKDLVILDEPTDGFSEQQLDKMRDVLQQLKVKQLILVSHEQKIESFVDKVIRFKKEGGVTKVETQ